MTKWLRSLYAWMLHWADTPVGTWALFFIAFAEASFFPLPPDILLLALGFSTPARSFFFATLSTLGSVSGAVVGYAIGFWFWDVTSGLFYTWVPGFTPLLFQQMQDNFAQYGFWIVFTAGFTPIPYKIITIGAGVFALNLPIFILASFISRGMRFFMLAALMYFYGEQARAFTEHHFNKLSIAFCVLLVGGFVLIRYIF
ncbi:MAG: YqaA family protein [Desulfuromonadaceae bacterium]